MIEKLIPIKLPPGLYHNGTKYEARGRWYDANLIRWREGILQPVGGWRRARSSDGSSMAAAGATDAARVGGFLRADGSKRIVIGIDTPLLYAYNPGASTTNLSDITPSGAIGTFWSFDVLNNTLIIYNGGKIFEWDGTLANIATRITNDPTADNIVVTPEQFLVALGSSSDKRIVAWASQGTTDTWTAASDNTAGDFTLRTDGSLQCGFRTKGSTLLLTTTDAWEMVYQGGEVVYGFRQVGDNCGAVSEGAGAVVGDTVYWMGRKGFYRYNGFVQQIRCDVAEKVFGEINTVEPSQVETMVNGDFGEVWWFYSNGSSSGAPNTRYVVYNYIEDIWYYGALDRLAGLAPGVMSQPLMIDSAGALWEHEILQDRGSETPYIESGPFEIGNGDQLMRIQQIVPDGGTTADVRMYLYTSTFPTSSETTSGPFTLANPTSVRVTGRQARVKVEQVNETAWRFGVPRLGVLPSSRR